MSTRIRYETNDGLLVSRQVLVGSNGQQLQAIINTMTLEVVILDVVENSSVLVETVKTLAQAKKAAKRMLSSLGVVFSEENRSRTNSNQTLGESNEKSTTT